MCNDVLEKDDISVFWSEHSANVLFDHLLSQLIEPGLTDSSEKEIERYLTLMRDLKSEN